jgi:hypothetical protein
MMRYAILLRPLLVIVALICAATGVAQTPGMVVFGTVRDMNTRDSIPFPVVLVQEVGSKEPPMPIVSTARGRYEVTITAQKTYLIRYGASGKVTKCVQLELQGPSAEDWAYGFGMNIDITLLDSLPGVDYSVLSEPFGITRFNGTTGSYEWDIEYTRSMADRQKALLDAYRERVRQQEWKGR